MGDDDGGVMRLRRGAGGVIENLGDDIGDYLDTMPAAIQEFRSATIALSRQMFARGGSWRPAKVCRRRLSAGASAQEIGTLFSVSGYVTLLRFLLGRSPQQLESVLGFRSGMLAPGADVLVIADELAPEQFAPRGSSAWSAGASPRDLARYGAGSHADYPAAAEPVYQWVIHRDRPARACKVATLDYLTPLRIVSA